MAGYTRVPDSSGYDAPNSYRNLADPVAPGIGSLRNINEAPGSPRMEPLSAANSIRNLNPIGNSVGRVSPRMDNSSGTRLNDNSSSMRLAENGSSMRLNDTGSSVRLTIPPNQFELDAADGLTSSNFDLRENIAGADERQGLKDDDKVHVRTLMSEGHDFDSARLEMNRQRMRDAGIDPDTGLPLDPRAVTFEDLRRMTDKSLRAKCAQVAQRFGLTPRRVVVIALLALLAYWVLQHSGWRTYLGMSAESWTVDVAPEGI